MTSPEVMLRDTPYLIPDDPASLLAFEKVAARTAETAARAKQSQSQIGQEAGILLAPFLLFQRSDLVAESNQIEGYDVTRRQVQEAVEAHRELIDGPVHALLEVLRADPKIVTALGLFAAQQLADEWAHREQRPQAYELRQLHSLITADERLGGRLRTFDVAIGGTHFRPPAHYDVPQAMDTFAAWWQTSTGDPILDAAVAHAWLTHIHPFEDGNGRLARVLANMVPAKAGYPPLIVRVVADRGQYYSALAESDDGNILPLYTLFAQIIRRTAKVMAAPGYVRDVLEDRLLRSEQEKHAAWCALTTSFRANLGRELAARGWNLQEQGLPDVSSFSLLASRDADGNGWWTLSGTTTAGGGGSCGSATTRRSCWTSRAARPLATPASLSAGRWMSRTHLIPSYGSRSTLVRTCLPSCGDARAACSTAACPVSEFLTAGSESGA